MFTQQPGSSFFLMLLSPFVVLDVAISEDTTAVHQGTVSQPRADNTDM